MPMKTDMKLAQAKKRLESLGFTFNEARFGTIKAEFYDVSPNHFSPIHRDIWISPKSKNVDPKTKNAYHISSSINGIYRKYRARYSYKRELANIFSMGKTLKEAVENFEKDFRAKNYNIS